METTGWPSRVEAARSRCRRARGGSAAPASPAPRAARTSPGPARGRRSFRTDGTSRARRYDRAGSARRRVCQSNFKLVCDLGLVPRKAESSDEIPAHSLNPSSAGRARRPRGRDRRRHGDRRRRRRSRPGAQAPSRSPPRCTTALTAPAVTGITADISFTNNLIDASELPGAQRPDPAAAPPAGCGCRRPPAAARASVEQRRRPVVVNQQLVLDLRPGLADRLRGHAARRSRPAAPSADKPAAKRRPRHPHGRPDPDRSQQADGSTSTCPARLPSDVAGQAAYTRQHLAQARRRPARLGRAGLGRDHAASRCGSPIYARGNPHAGARADGDQHLLRAGRRRRTSTSRRPPAPRWSRSRRRPSTPRRPPRPRRRGKRHGAPSRGRRRRRGRRPAAVQARRRPSTLVGLPRHGVKLLDWGGKPAALVTYGQSLGGIAVIEQPAVGARQRDRELGPGRPARRAQPADGLDQRRHRPGARHRAGHGASASRRGGVAYTVLGSVPAAAAERGGARAL